MIDLDTATYAAFYAAANVVSKLDPAVNSLSWLSLGRRPAESPEIEEAAQFVRDYPAPAEALWRFAHARLWHDGDPHGFYDAPDIEQLPYAVFHAVVLATDDATRTIERHRAQRAILTVAPPPAGPDDAEGTILERHGSMLDRVAHAPPLPPPQRTKRSTRHK